jgi:hypothetical protein
MGDLADIGLRMGFVQDRTATAKSAQALMMARRIRPEARFLSSKITGLLHENEED